MKFGMNLLLWTDNLTEEHRPILEKLKRMGYDGIEAPVFDLNPDKFAAVGLWLDDLGLERTARHVPRRRRQSRSSPTRKVRAAGVANNKLALECCQAAGMNILAGPFHSALGYFYRRGRRRPTNGNGRVDSMRAVAEHAEACGVTLGGRVPEPLRVLSAQLRRRYVPLCARTSIIPTCRMMYDTFHANIEEKELRRGDPRLRRRNGSRPHFGKRSRHAGRRERPLGRDLRRTQRGGLRRLADDRGLWPGAAGPGRGHENLAADVQDRRATGPDGLAFMKREWKSRAAAT